MQEFALIPKILPALRRLCLHYEKDGETDICNFIISSSIHIEPNTEYDNWNGGTYGHDVHLFVPEDSITIIDLNRQQEFCDKIRDDINTATTSIENEYVRSVHIALIDPDDTQSQSAVPFTKEPRARPEDVGIWKENHLRLFISHRDKDKADAHRLAEALEPFGISSFVAHDAIKPMKEWQKEILNALITMEVMLVFLTDDFHESNWTNQEVGFALGKGIPIIALKCGKIDPQGFISSKQAMKIQLGDWGAAASGVHGLLVDEVGQEGRLKDILIEAFLSSPNFIETMARLDRLSKTTDRLTDKQFERIVSGYMENDQLHNCGGIHARGNWFKRFLETSTGKKIFIDGPFIREIETGSADEIPF